MTKERGSSGNLNYLRRWKTRSMLEEQKTGKVGKRGQTHKRGMKPEKRPPSGLRKKGGRGGGTDGGVYQTRKEWIGRRRSRQHLHSWERAHQKSAK